MKRTIFTRWLKNREGNTAIIFALSAVPLILMTGGVVDMAYVYKARTQAQTASDAAVLAAAAAEDKTDAERQEIARRMFASQFDTSMLKKPLTLTISQDKGQLDVDATISVPTNFLKIISIRTMDGNIHSQVKMGSAAPLEVALVLDNTYSMHGTKIESLRAAAKDMVQKLHDKAASTKTGLKIGLVPYTRYVRLDKSYRGKWWLALDEREEEVPQTNCRDEPVTEEYNCHDEPVDCPVVDGVSQGENCTEQVCDERETGEVEHVCDGGYTWRKKWTGCVASRPDPQYVTDSDYATFKVPGMHTKEDGHGPHDCPHEIVPLVDVSQDTNKQILDDVIDDMDADGEQTYVPGGLKWGWHMLSPNEPLNEARPYDKDHVKKAIVLMTDGENTVYANGVDKLHHKGHDAKSKANAVLARLCTNIKAKGIAIYTVAFEVTDATTKNALKSCASSAGNYYDATNSADLADAFDAIGKSLISMYLAE